MLKIHVLQHEPFEGPGLIHDWANERGHTLTITEVFNNEALPQVETFDWLVIMGGGMSVNDEDKYAWLKPEKQFVKQVIDAGKMVLGICLGSQMIADVLGSKVYKNNDKEIGWYPVQLTEAGTGTFNKEWNNQTFFHWHGETFNLPEGAERLAYSAGCKNQAFRYGSNVFGLQFHPETNNQTLHQMVSSGSAELVPDKFVMGAEDILQQKEITAAIRPLFYEWLDKLAK